MAQHFNPDRLEALRLAHGLTKDQFAKKIGITRQIVHLWLTGKQQPTVRTVQKIAEAFGLDSAYFFADTVHQTGEQEVA